MVALASAFVRLRPEVDRNEWRRAGQQAGDQAGRDTGKSYGEGFKRGAGGGLRDTNGKFVKDSSAVGTRAGRGFASEFTRNASKLDAVSDSLGRIGLVGVGAFGLVVKSAADFDKQMSSVAAATHAGTQQIGQLREAALQAGADTAFSATDAARGIEELSKAGVSTASVLGGGLKGALDLAAAGQLDVGEAAETAASAMTQFKLQGGQVPHVADLLAAAAGKAQGSVHDMGFALSQAGLVASQMGLSVEDTTGTLAAFASAGLLGSDAGTSFKTMLLALQNPTSKSSDSMKELGINAYDAAGNFVGITNLAGQLQTRLGGLSQAQRDATLAQIFGSDAIRAASILYRQGQSGIQDWIDKTNDAGFAAETARIKTDNLAGDIERLTGSFSTLAIESGGGANSGLRVITKSANALVNSVSALPPGLTATVTVMAGVAGGAALLGAGYLKLRASNTEMLTKLRATGPAGQRAATGLVAAGKGARVASLGFVALTAANAAFSALQSDLNPQIDGLSAGLAEYADSGRLAGEASRVLGGDLHDLNVGFAFLADEDNARRAAVKGLQGTLEGLIQPLAGTNTSLTRTKERISAVDTALAQLVQGGQAVQARSAFDALAKTLATGGVSLDEFSKQFPQYAAAVQAAGSASATAAVGVKAVGDASGDAADKAKDAQAAFEDLFGVFMTSDLAAIKYQGTLASTTKELKEGKRSLDLGSEAGRQNRAAVLDLIAATEDQRTANIDNGASVADADKEYKTHIASLIKTMTHLGFNKKAVEDLVGKYRDVPKTVSTTIKTPGLPAADKGIKDYDKKLDALARQIRTEVNVTGVSGAYAQLKDLLIAQQALKKGISISAAKSAYGKQEAAAFALGGQVPGWSPTRTADNIPAMLTAKEFVQPVDAVDYYGVPFMEAIRRRLVPKDVAAAVASYARGGYVLTAPFPVNAGVTRIPSRDEAMSAVTPAAPRGATLPWIERMVHAAFPGMPLISGFRRGARTLSGNISYHALDRAGDWPASLALAKYWNARFKAITKEFISPWNRYNILNGAQHSYTGAIYRQHSGTNAHDHIAVGKGGLAGRLAKAANIPVRLFDSGGAWPSGTLGANLSGRTEYVYPGGPGGISITLVNHGVIGSQGELDAWLTKSVRRLRNERKLP